MSHTTNRIQVSKGRPNIRNKDEAAPGWRDEVDGRRGVNWAGRKQKGPRWCGVARSSQDFDGLIPKERERMSGARERGVAGVNEAGARDLHIGALPALQIRVMFRRRRCSCPKLNGVRRFPPVWRVTRCV